VIDPTRRLLPLLLLAAAALGQSTLVDRVAASVNDTAIPESAVRRALVLSPLARDADEAPEAYRSRVLDALIDQHLQYEGAERFGPAPPDAADVEAAMARVRQRLVEEGKVPEEEFARAGMTVADVRASVERQLVVQRYLQDRFRPIAIADEGRARSEYEEFYVPEQRAAGLPATPYEQVAEQMRERSQQRGFDEEVARWIAELRDKAKITIYPTPTSATGQGPPVLIATAPPAAATPAPATPN
jgi:parvulin-like peptidyl-prolyl isomerase